MHSIQISGTIPNFMRENSEPGDWRGGLTLTGDTADLVAVETIGPDALAFAAAWNPKLNLLTLDPAAQVDYEAFLAAGTQPQLAFSFRYTFADGTRLEDATTYCVTVIDADDTAPTGLRFITGGSVTAGEIGSIIGTLAVTDPDSAGPFTFTFPEEDAWRFEVVGTTLKLRDGISLDLNDLPGRPVFVTVSDGRQSAGFTLTVTVREPGNDHSAVEVVTPEAPQAGFDLTDPAQAVTLREAREVAAANSYGEELRQITLAEGGEVWLPAVQTLRLADGWMDYDPTGAAVRAAALHATLTGQEASGTELGLLVGQMQTGQGWVDLAASLLPGEAAALDDAALVTSLYRDALGRDPDAAELALQAGRLASGTDRAQIVADLAGSEAALAAQAEAEGTWVFQPLGGAAAWQTDTGGFPVGQGAAASQPANAAWML